MVLKTANTYDWIIATAASRISSRFCAVISAVVLCVLLMVHYSLAVSAGGVLQLCLQLGVLLVFLVPLDY